MLHGMLHINPTDVIDLNDAKVEPKQTLKLVYNDGLNKVVHTLDASKNSYTRTSDWKGYEGKPLTDAKEITPKVLKDVMEEAIARSNETVNHESYHTLQKIEADGELVYDASKVAEKKIAIDAEVMKTPEGEKVTEISLARGDGEEIFHGKYDGKTKNLSDDKKEIETILHRADTIVGFDMSSELKALQKGGIDLPKEEKYLDTFKASEKFAKEEIKAGHSRAESFTNYIIEMNALDMPTDKCSNRSYYVMNTFADAKQDRGDYAKVPQLDEKSSKLSLKEAMKDSRSHHKKLGITRKGSSQSKGRDM